MRSPIIGVVYGSEPEKLRRFVEASTKITHSDPKALVGALAVALAAWHSASGEEPSHPRYLQELESLLAGCPAADFMALAHRSVRSAALGQSTKEFAEALGPRAGISGYIYHTVPCVLQAWFRYPNAFESGTRAIIEAGGDTDTAAAIYGGIVAAGTGEAGIPVSWLQNIIEWPRSIGWMRRLGTATARAAKGEFDERGLRYCRFGLVPRNLVFLLTVLTHGLRRLAPPY